MRRQQGGLTLIELVIAVVLIATLAAIVAPAYEDFVDRGKVAGASGDISMISGSVDRFYYRYNRYPDSLAEVGMDGVLDPWDNPYRYLNIWDSDKPGKGGVRKDKNLVPINSDYDLYSMGKDGKSVSPLTAKASRDDIVRANNGRYIGLAEDY